MVITKHLPIKQKDDQNLMMVEVGWYGREQRKEKEREF
jgi:hypothetical protein